MPKQSPSSRRTAAWFCSAARWSPWVLLLAGAASPLPASAQCPEASAPVPWWSDREASIRLQEQLPDACLKRLVRQCDTDAEAGLMDAGNAAVCSVRYEALLRHGFRGDFPALLRWWRSGTPVASQ